MTHQDAAQALSNNTIKWAKNGTEKTMPYQPGVEMTARKIGRRGNSVRVEIIDITVAGDKSRWIGQVVTLNEIASAIHFSA